MRRIVLLPLMMSMVGLCWVSGCTPTSTSNNGQSSELFSLKCKGYNEADCASTSYLGCTWSKVANDCVGWFDSCSEYAGDKCPIDQGCLPSNGKCDSGHCLGRSQDTCTADVGCAYESYYFTSVCSPLKCTSIDNKAGCDTANCAWDDINKCLSPWTSSCSSATKAGSCSQIAECIWNPSKTDPKTGECLSNLTASCGNFNEAVGCGAATGCFWAGDGCQSSLRFCQQYDVQDSCLKGNCVWKDGACGTKKFCTNYPKNDCTTTPGCVWDDVVCLSSTTTACQVFSSKTACTLSGCVYDDQSKACLSKRTSGCSNYNDPAQCRSVGCLYDTEKKACLSGWLNSCSAYSQSTCADAGCLWSTSSKQCISKVIGCSQYEAAQCPIDQGCKVVKTQDGSSKCSAPGCGYNVLKDDCNADVDCQWDPRGTDTRPLGICIQKAKG